MRVLPISLLLMLSGGIFTASPAAVPSVCDIKYAQNMQSLLDQAAGFASAKKLKDYSDYMILIKLAEDLTFKVHAFESQISAISSYVLAQLRIPLTRYNTCRNTRAVYSSITATMCDNTYAAYMNKALKTLAISNDANRLEAYRQFMVNLKNLADTRFRVHDLETVTGLDYISTLRSPLTFYLGCRDELIRSFGKPIS